MVLLGCVCRLLLPRDCTGAQVLPCLIASYIVVRNVSLVAAVNSVLAIGGVGGLAVGLAGREILENLFTGLIILSSSPFEVGDEVLFTPPTGSVSPALLSQAMLHLMCVC